MRKSILPLLMTVCIALPICAHAEDSTECFGKMQSIALDGNVYNVPSYNIEGYNYYSLRDISYITKDTEADFLVVWDEMSRTVIIDTLSDGVNSGIDMNVSLKEKAYAVSSDAHVSADGKFVFPKAYNIDGYTYFKLRDLADILGFDAEWSEAERRTEINTIKGSMPILPKEYQKMLGRGMDVDWSKTKAGKEYYNERTAEDFAAAGISHVRIRIADDADEELFRGLDGQIDDCLKNGIIPIIAYQADDFKNDPSDKNMKKVIKWWKNVAERYKDKSYLLAFDLIIEATDELNKQPDKLNELYEKTVSEIRKTNPERIIIISPRLRSDAYYLNELEIPSDGNGYIMAEWHFYAAGPSKTNERKLWTTGTLQEKKLITDKIDEALEWQEKTGIPTWVGAWMPGNYNDGNDYTIEEQIEFASFMTESLERAGIPYAVNSDTKFYNRETNEWYEEMIPLRNIIYS